MEAGRCGRAKNTPERQKKAKGYTPFVSRTARARRVKPHEASRLANLGGTAESHVFVPWGRKRGFF